MAELLWPHIGGGIQISGRFGIGKTWLATMLASPDNTAMLDCDFKSQQLAESLGIWYQGTAYGGPDAFAYDLNALGKWAQESIKDIPEGKANLIIDNATYLEAAFGVVVAANPEKYGVRRGNVEKNMYGGVNPGVSRIWERVFQVVLNQKKYRAITIITHVGQPWVDGKPVLNKWLAKGNKALAQLCNLCLVLTRTPGQSSPAALVTKENFGMLTFADGKYQAKKVFPARFPVAMWENIAGYFAHPADFTNPAPGEVPSPAELAMYDDFYTPEQIEWIKLLATTGASFSEDGSETGVVTADLTNEPLADYANSDTLAAWMASVGATPYHNDWLMAALNNNTADITCGQAAERYVKGIKTLVKKIPVAELAKRLELPVEKLTELAGTALNVSNMTYLELLVKAKAYKDSQVGA